MKKLEKTVAGIPATVFLSFVVAVLSSSYRRRGSDS
jgi:hypothetical protein